jgi:hypothetical protein
MGLPVGIQLYTVRGVIQNDTPGTLKQVYKIGYREVETAGFGKYPAKEFGQLIKDAGLSCPSAHLQFNTADLGPAFDDAHALGVTYATSSILSLEAAPGNTSASPAKPRPRLPVGINEFISRAPPGMDIPIPGHGSRMNN